MNRDTALRAFIDAARKAYDAQVTDPKGRASVARAFEALARPLETRDVTPERLSACAHLKEVLQSERYPEGPLQNVVEAFRTLEPHLKWRERSGDTAHANEAFFGGHALSMIVGPGGLAPHSQVYLGVNLQGPDVRYPDHTHPPEETYLVLSEGEFSQDGVTWFRPGVGGTFYNPPGILHAMRSGDAPLFAIWVLWAEKF